MESQPKNPEFRNNPENSPMWMESYLVIYQEEWFSHKKD